MNFFRSTIFWLAIIFFSASIFRLSFLNLTEFKLDEALMVFEMAKFSHAPYFIQLGLVQSTGVHNFPMTYYAFVAISALSRNPLFMSAVVAFLNTCAVAGLYWVLRKFYTPLTAIAVSLFLAFSPWAILFSRKIWVPDLIMVLLVPFIYFVHNFFVNRKKEAIFGMVLSLALIVQIHYSGIFLGIATLIIMGILRTKLSLKHAILGAAIGLIPALPFFAYQIQNGCPDCQAFSNYQGDVRDFDVNAFLRPFEFVNGSSFVEVLGNDYDTFLAGAPGLAITPIIFMLEFVLLILGAIYVLSNKREYTFVLLYVILMPLLYFITKTPAHLYYFLVIMPFTLILYALGVEFMGKKREIFITIITVIVVINVIFESFFYSFLNDKKTIAGDYGPVYEVTRSEIDRQTAQYGSLPEYELIRAAAYVKLAGSIVP